MNSRDERFLANSARYMSYAFRCCVPVEERQYLDVRVRENGQGSARVGQTFIRVFAHGSNDVLKQKRTDGLGDAIIRVRPGNPGISRRMSAETASLWPRTARPSCGLTKRPWSSSFMWMATATAPSTLNPKHR